MEERIRSTRSSLAVFVGCCAMSFIGFALITNTSGLYFDAISRDLHVGRAKVSLTVSIRLICSAISMAAFSRFSHRIRLRPTLIGCIGICAVGFLLCSRAYALWQFYLAFAVMGLAYVIPITLMPPILLAAWFPTHFGTVLGITGCLSGLGGAIFNPLISHVIASYGWRSAYLLTGAMLMVLLLPCSYLLKPYPHGKLDTASAPNAKPAHDTRTKSGHLIGMLRSPAFLLLGVIRVAGFYYQSTGKIGSSSLLIYGDAFFALPLCLFLLPLRLGMDGVWLAMPVSRVILFAMLCYLWFGKRRERELHAGK